MLLEFKNVTGITKGFNLTDISFQIPAGYLVGLAGKMVRAKQRCCTILRMGKNNIPVPSVFRGKSCIIPIQNF